MRHMATCFLRTLLQGPRILVQHIAREPAICQPMLHFEGFIVHFSVALGRLPHRLLTVSQSTGPLTVCSSGTPLLYKGNKRGAEWPSILLGGMKRNTRSIGSKARAESGRRAGAHRRPKITLLWIPSTGRWVPNTASWLAYIPPVTSHHTSHVLFSATESWWFHDRTLWCKSGAFRY